VAIFKKKTLFMLLDFVGDITFLMFTSFKIPFMTGNSGIINAFGSSVNLENWQKYVSRVSFDD
jgi:hypothetical protein